MPERSPEGGWIRRLRATAPVLLAALAQLAVIVICAFDLLFPSKGEHLSSREDHFRMIFYEHPVRLLLFFGLLAFSVPILANSISPLLLNALRGVIIGTRITERIGAIRFRYFWRARRGALGLTLICCGLIIGGLFPGPLTGLALPLGLLLLWAAQRYRNSRRWLEEIITAREADAP
jgi:hypothetical protein